MICRGRGWGCFRRGSSLTKGLEGSRQGAASDSTWLGRARNEWSPQSGTMSWSVHYLRPHPSPPAEQASSHSQMSGDSQGDDQGPANTAFTSTISHRLSGPETSARLHLISTCSESSPPALTEGEEKHLTRGLLQRFFFLDWVLKYGDLWLIVQFIKVIFPVAVILGLLTHQGCPCSHP